MDLKYKEFQMSYYNPFALKGKTILVTGASSGIGQATAIECSRMGAKLVITGRSSERLQQTFDQLEGDGHLQIIADLTNEDAIVNLVNNSPNLEGVVLCAGRGLTLPFQFCTREKFDSVFSTNFFAPTELLRLLVKKKKIVREGSVVLVASIGGTPGGKITLGNSIYGMSKAAVVSMMRFAAKELAPKKIRVNSVNPGMVETRMINTGTFTEDQYKADIAKYPLSRYGKPNDIAHGIIYLLSDASSWVTGHALVIDGGVTI